MARSGGRGSTLIEVLAAVAVLGAGLGGLTLLVAACSREEGRLARHLQARLQAISMLEPGSSIAGPFPAALRSVPGRAEVQVTWEAPAERGQGRSLSLLRRGGHARP